MSKLRRLSGRDCVRALAKVGFPQKRQHGSHIILRRDEHFAILRQAILDVDAFNALLE